MIKYISAILGFYAIIKYVLWCNLSYALFDIDSSFTVPQSINDMTNLVIYATLAISFFVIGRSEKDKINRLFIYYAIAEFWGFLSLQIAVNLIFPKALIFKIYITSLLIILVLNFLLALYYLIVWLLNSR
jgi:hypothetical protein